MEKTLGGDRLGSGKKQKVEMHNYERSTHDLGYLWRSSMSAGTLVPFLKEVALPGDTFDIELDCDIKTHPTIGPLFGSFKIQLDIFQGPIRLYQGKLHNNKLGIGLKMSDVKLPYIDIHAIPITNAQALTIDLDNAQINPSCILSYLGMRGVGYTEQNNTYRRFNGVPLLMYWDTYKNYYANKQEEIGAVIHTPISAASTEVVQIQHYREPGAAATVLPLVPPGNPAFLQVFSNVSLIYVTVNAGQVQDLSQINVFIKDSSSPTPFPRKLSDVTSLIAKVGDVYQLQWTFQGYGNTFIEYWQYRSVNQPSIGAIQVQTFALSEIDDMREQILAAATQSAGFDINASNLEPYDFLFNGVSPVMAVAQSQEGLAIKTYQSDLLNNWIQTEWLDGVDGITAITAVDTSAGSFTMDTLLLSRKVYDMLNRIAISGGTYQDWLDAVYTHPTQWRCETPMYMGGLIKELVFQEVVSNSQSATEETGTQPLGTLAGKGIMSKKHKGGRVTIKVDEPSYIMGIVSITPRLDYSQGNDWDTHLLTMDDLHKPALDQIGFQELITEQMAWWDTSNVTGVLTDWVTKSAGKQPAWINYMTNINKVRGNFAVESNEMFMVLNRKYQPKDDGAVLAITDLTTYIDPTKFNNIFSQTSLDSQNFWTQISVDMNVRRKISAKVIPNL